MDLFIGELVEKKQTNWWLLVDDVFAFTLGSTNTLISWGRTKSDDESTSWRTLWRTLPDDHPIIIANNDDRVTFFFYTKGRQMYLEVNKENTIAPKGPFRYGDVVFFGGGAWYGSAPGLADIYEKKTAD